MCYADPIVQSAAAARSDLPAERWQHRAADTPVCDHIRQGEAAFPRQGRPPRNTSDEHRPAARRRVGDRAVRCAHEVRPDARRGLARRRDDADPSACHLPVFAGPRSPAVRAGDSLPPAGVLHAAAALPSVPIPGQRRAVAVSSSTDDVDRHTKSRRGAFARSTEGKSGGNPTADEGSL